MHHLAALGTIQHNHTIFVSNSENLKAVLGREKRESRVWMMVVQCCACKGAVSQSYHGHQDARLALILERGLRPEAS